MQDDSLPLRALRQGWSAVGGSDRSRLKLGERGAPCSATLVYVPAYVTFSLLNSADYPAFSDRKTGNSVYCLRIQTTLHIPPIQMGQNRFIIS